MNILNVIQGSAEWHAARDTHYCASDAPAMMGASKYKSRAELIKEKATGITEAITPEKQFLFDRGHASEASIRPYIGSVIGDELYPVVLEEGRLLASLDGITVDDETIFEHKLWNEGLAKQIELGALEPHYYWQIEHQLLVSKAKRVVFVTSDGTPEKCAHMFYEPVPGRAETLLAGWDQFDADLKAYAVPIPDAILERKALMALPALSVQLVGKVTTSNLPAYRNSALEFIKAINTELKSDQDFADAEQTVKFCDDAEKNLQTVKDQAIAQTASIDELFRAIDQISDAMRQKRLMLEKLVKSRKEQIRGEIVQASRDNWNAHIGALNRTLARVSVTVLAPDFAAAIKGKRTLSGLRDGVDSALTTAKIAATQQAELFTSRLAIIDEVAKEHPFLVRDLSALVVMPTEMLSAVVRQRIADYKAEQDRKAEARLRLEREAHETQLRAERDAQEATAKIERDRLTAEREAQEETARAERERLSAERAELELAQAALRRQTEAPVLVLTPSAEMRVPSSEEIIQVLSDHYQVSVLTVADWLAQLDFSELQFAEAG